MPNSLSTKLFLEALKEEYKKYHLILIWDNAPFHKKKELHTIVDLTPIFLPPYSPKLELPLEGTILLKDFMEKLEDDSTKTKKLCGYSWILEQWEEVV